MNLYVSNLGFDVSDQELKTLFAPFGEVSSAKIIMDRDTGRSRGFGFVEMPKDDEARQAISGVDGSMVSGRNVKVVEARPKENNGNNRRF
jgi:RNA recognition motif-containing protein